MLLTVSVIGQTEAEMKVQADKLFDNGQYLDATPLYLRLLSLQPRDGNYNYRYGTCVLYNSNNKPDAIKYLGYAINDPNVAPEAYYFLGKAFHLNYQFNEAIKHYTTYNEKKAQAVKKFDADREIQMCQNGKRLMTTISDLIVIDKKEITSDKFFRIYELNDIGGSLLVTADFQTKIDKRNNHIPLIHFPQNPTVIYYSSYGDNESTGKDIYVRRRLPDGSWGAPQPLPGNVNTKFDEDFPYMHPDGNYLYFSSKGHNSMGGFDVFRSKFDPESNSFGPPENMDFAISSPDDDLFYIVDSLNKNAYFASARQSQEGKLFVYKVKVDRVPLQLAVVKGNFVSDVDASKRRIDFEILDYSNGENIGRFNSNEKAVYLITFPKGGKYEFIMHVEGSPQEFRSIVSIPFLKEFKPLKQKIVHTIEDGKEVVKIINLFNEEVEDPQAVIAEVIKMRSNLNVNVQEFDMDKLEEEKKNQEFLNELGFEDLLLVEVSEALKDEAKRARTNKLEIEQVNNNINNLVVQNGQDFARLEEQIKTKVADANKTENPENKYILLREADQLIKKQTQLKESSKQLLLLQDSVNLVAKTSSTTGKIDQLDQVASQFDKLYREGKEKEAIAYLKENKELIRNAKNDNTTELKKNLVERVVKLNDDLTILSKRVDGYNKDIKDLEIEIQSLENSLYSVKKKELEVLEQKISSKKEEIEMIRAERTKIEKKSDVLSDEKYLINKQIEVLETALTNPTLAKVSREEANKSVQVTAKTNTNTLTNYVQQRIAELEKNDPSLRERIVVSSGMKGDNIMAEHQTLKLRIENTPGITKQERMSRLIATTSSTKRALEERLNDVETQLAKNKFDDKLNKEKQQIIRDLEQLELELNSYQQELDASQSSEIASVDPKVIQKQIDPEYETKSAAIIGDKNLSAEERLVKQQELDQNLLSEIDQKIALNKNAIQADPSNQQLKKNQQALNQLKEEKQKIVIERGNEINQNAAQSNVSYSSEEIIKKTDPAYIERFTSIQNDRSKPEVQRFSELQKEDKKLINRLNERVTQLEKQLKITPQDKNALAELDALKSALKEKNQTVLERENAIAVLEKGTQSLSKEDLLTQVDPLYDNKMESLQNNRSLTEIQRLEQLNVEDSRLIQKINEQISMKQEQLNNDPENKKINEEISLLEALKSEKLTHIENRKEKITVLGNTTELASTDKLIQDYTQRINEIESNGSWSKEEKLIEKLKEDQALVQKINDQIEEIEAESSTNPSTKTQLDELRTLKAKTESDIDERENELNKEKGQTYSVDQLTAEVDPDYVKAIKGIQENVKLTEQEKLGKIQLREKELLTHIEAELTSVDQKLKSDPSNSQLISKKEQLNELKSSVEGRIEERNQLIESQAVSSLTEEQLVVMKKDVLKEVDAAYEKKKNSFLTNEDGKSYDELIVLEEKLIVKLEAERKSTQKIISKDPSNQDAIVKMKAIDELIRDTQAEQEKWQVLKQEAQPFVASENEKDELIAELNPTYQEKQRVLAANKDVVSLKTQLRNEQDLLSDIKARIEADEMVLAEDPGNKELEKELKILALLKEETEKRIEQLNSEIQALPLVVNNYSKEELTSRMEEMDPSYATKVREIEQDKGMSELDRLEELNVTDRSLQNTVLERMNELETEPYSSENQKEKEQLEQISAQLELAITDREKQINDLKTMKPLSSILSEEWIDQIDQSYRKDVQFIQENNSFDQLKKLELVQQKDLGLLAKVTERLEIISKMAEPKLVEFTNEEKRLLVLKEQLTQATRERRIEIEQLTANSLTSVPEKEDVIEKIMPGYASNLLAIEADASLEQDLKKDLIIQLEEALQQKTEQRMDEVAVELKSNSTNAVLLKEQESLQQILAESKSKVSVLQSEKVITSDQKERVIADLLPDYNSRTEALAISKMEESKKIDAQLKLDNELLSKIQAETKAIQKQLDKDPTNAKLAERLEVLKLLAEEQQAKIDLLQNKRIGFVNAELTENAIRNADKSYADDLKMIEQNDNVSEKEQALVQREKLHQENIAKQIEINDQSLAKKNNPELIAVNAALKEELVKSSERENALQTESSSGNDVVAEEKRYIENLREDLLSGNSTQLSAKNSSVESLQGQDQVLAQYEKDLKLEITAVQKELASDPSKNELKKELEWLNNELSKVQTKRREIRISVGELETELISARVNERTVSSPELQQLEQEEQRLEQKLKQENLTSTERKQVEKQLSLNQEKQLSTENELLKSDATERNEKINSGLDVLKSDPAPTASLKLIEKQVESEMADAKSLLAESEKTKNPIEKNFLLNEAIEKQNKAEALVENAQYEQELKRIEEEYGLSSMEAREDLEKKKRRYTIEVGELTTEIEALTREISTADKKSAVELSKIKAIKLEEKVLLQEKLSEVESALASLTTVRPSLDPASKDVVMSFNEERDLASTREYATYVEKVNEALRIDEQIINLENQLNENNALIKSLVAANLATPTESKKADLATAAAKSKQLESQLTELRTELTQKQEAANLTLSQNEEEAMRMQNLVRRGIVPISKIAVVAALVPMPASGLDINTAGAGTYSEANRIPVNVNSPQGLVYRVQIGAFAKPIEQDRFKEFTPVSGETLNNGITRYMAGYFNNSGRVMEAMNQIRALGYADAFPVAYCDGKRISIGEARRLEASGECVPKGVNELMLEMAANTAVNMGLEDTTKLRKVPEFTYNQAPGAAKAEAIEIRKGLFFTVQIGVYNKPVPSATLFNLDPYMTLRLPNGQIRYSTGIYHSIDEARPRKQEAINRGVKDAFITAYFNGDRIPINDALAMLNERGASVLEPKEKLTESVVGVNETTIITPVNVVKTEAPIELPKKPEVFIQIVTKKQFEIFPTDVLNRYNSHGSFYYDEVDKRVKSSIANSEDNLPQVYYFREDVDTVKYLSSTEFIQGTILSLTFAEGKLPGDVVDWLLKQNFRKEYQQSEEGVRLLIYGVPEDKTVQMEEELAVFGMSFLKVSPQEEEK